MQTTIRWALYILVIEVILLICLRASLLSLAPPLTASCLLLSVNPQGLFARPRTVLLAYMTIGHLGLFNSVFFGNALFGILVMTLLGVCLMAIVPCIHPPAIGFPFLLAQTSSPFRVYFITLGLVGGILILHYVSQWIMAQLYKTNQVDLPQTRFTQSAAPDSLIKGAYHDSLISSNHAQQSILRKDESATLDLK